MLDKREQHTNSKQSYLYASANIKLTKFIASIYCYPVKYHPAIFLGGQIESTNNRRYGQGWS